MAIILVSALVGSTHGGRIGDFDNHAALDTAVPAVGYVQVALSVDHHSVMVEELTQIRTRNHTAIARAAARWW